MRVAFISQPWDTVGPAGTGSIGIQTYQTARRLAQSCDVVVYAKADQVKPKADELEGIRFQRMALQPDQWSLRFLGSSSRLRKAKRPLYASTLYYMSYALQAATDLRKHKCDLVHIRQFSQFIPIIRAFNPRTKIILHMNCEWLTQLDGGMIARRLDKTDLVIGCSEYITDKVRRTFPQHADKCHTVFDGVDAKYFANRNSNGATKRKDITRLLFVGRVSPEKGLHVLLDALQIVVRQYPRVILDIVGPEAIPPLEFLVGLDEEVEKLKPYFSGSYLSKLRDSLSPSVEKNVSFVGPIPHSQTSGYYQNADIVVFPSVWNEPSGIPVAEAMACGLPVVATRSGGIGEILTDGKTGFLVDRGNADELAEAILRLLADEDLRKSMGQAGRQRVLELFSWDRISDCLLRHYDNLCVQEASR